MQNPLYAKLCYHTDSFGKALIYHKTILIPLKENYVPGNINFYSINLWMVLWRPPRHFRTNTPKRCLFHFRGLECKSRKSRNTWSNRQICPWSMEWSRKRLTEFCQDNTLIIAKTPLPQHKRTLYTWTSPDGQHWSDSLFYLQPKMEKLYTVSKNKTRSWLWLRSWTPYCQIQT